MKPLRAAAAPSRPCAGTPVVSQPATQLTRVFLVQKAMNSTHRDDIGKKFRNVIDATEKL